MADEAFQSPPQIDVPVQVPQSEQRPPLQAAVDPEALKATMSEAFEQGLSRFVAQHPPAPQQPPQVVQQRFENPPPPGEPDPVTKVIAPAVGPALRHLQMESLDAKDAAIFYGRDPGDNRKDFSPAIEEVVQHRRSLGMPVTREDAYYWLQGRYGPQIGQFREQQEMQRARYAATVGGGMGREIQQPSQKDPHDMTDQELNEALKGKIF